MADFKEKILKLDPTATFEVGPDGITTLSVDEKAWHTVAMTLRDDSSTAFDYLVTIVGMDWKESLGCIYYLSSTGRGGEMLAVKVIARGDRREPMIHSVSDLWEVAGIYEREVYDFFGIIFITNPDMRRLFLSIDWKGHPLLKD